MFKTHNERKFIGTSSRGFGIFFVLIFVAVGIGMFSLRESEPVGALTTVPTKMNFQGRLTDAGGSTKANGTYNMRFRLFTVASGGTPVWTEDRLVSAGQGVTLTNGLFAVQLGSVTSLPASLFASGQLYLEVELPTPASATSASPAWTEGAMTPRNQMATSAYAYNAETLDGMDSSDFAAATGGTGYVQNQNASAQTTTNFWISGNGRMNGTLTVGGASTLSGTLTVTGATTINNTLTVSSTIKAKAANLSGYITSNTSNTNAGQWTRLGNCTLTVQYQGCRTQATLTSSSDGGSISRGVIDIRVKQQNPLGSAPYVAINLLDASGLTAADVVAVPVTVQAGQTVVELYLRINPTYQTYGVSPLITTDNAQFTWQENQGFLVSLPAADVGMSNTVATYGSQNVSSLAINDTTVISSAGLVQSTALSGTYSNAVTFSNTSNVYYGSGANLTSLNASNLSSGTVASARISGSYTGITGTGALTAGSIGSGFGSISTGNTIATSGSLQGGSLSVGGNLVLAMPSNNPERGPYNPIWSAVGSGKPLYADEEFATGVNSVSVYNNSGGTAVTITRETGIVGVPNSTGNQLKVSYDGIGATSPNFAGVILPINASANKTFVQRFRAKVPAGKTLNIHENAQGTNNTSYWLTNNVGTGKWEDYLRVSHAGNTGTFSVGGHISISGGTGAFDWFIASMNVYEVNSSILAGANTWNGAQTFAGGADFTAANAINVGGTTVLTSGRALQNVTADAGILTSGTLASGRVSGSYTGITGTGALAAGSIANGFGSITTGSTIQGSQLISTVANGTAPLTVTSTTKVTDLNVDLLDGLDSTAFAAASGSASYIHNTTSPQTANFNVSGSGTIGGALAVTGGANINGDIDGNSKTVARTTDGWLRINPDNDFASGIYTGTGILRTDGTLQVGNGGAGLNVTSGGVVTAAGTVQGTRLISTVATGTAPLTVTSTTAVTNLNADLLDGQHGSYFQNATNLNAGTIADARLTSRIGQYAATVTDWDLATTNGWYMGFNIPNAPTASTWYIGDVVAHNGLWATQTVYAFTGDNSSNTQTWRRDSSDNAGTRVWGSWYKLQVSQAEQDARYASVSGSANYIHNTTSPQTANINITGSVTASGFSGSGSGLTNLSASNLSSGTINTARVSGSYTGITDVGTLVDLTVTGAATVGGSISRTQNNTQTYKNVHAYSSSTPNLTGTIALAAPKTWSNTMVRITIKGYDYHTNTGAWEVIVSGYNYTATPAWINNSVEIRGKAPFSSVRLGHNGTNNVILLGTTSTIWQYPKVVIEEVVAGHSSITGWGDGWTSSIVTSETGYTNIASPAVRTTLYEADLSGFVQLQGASPGTAQAGHLNLTGGGIFTQGAAGTTGLLVKGRTNHQLGEAPIFNVQDSSGNNILWVNHDAGNRVIVRGGSGFWGTAGLEVVAAESSAYGLVVKGAGGQTQKLLRVVNSANTELFSVGANGSISSAVSGGMYLQGGDDAALWDVNAANTVGIYGIQDASQGCIRLGNSGVSSVCGNGGGTTIGGNVSVNTITAADWVRTTGNSGWYNATHGGGMTMEDANWVRVSHSKNLYVQAGLDTGAAAGINCGGGLGAGYNLRVCGTAHTTSDFYVGGVTTLGNVPIENSVALCRNGSGTVVRASSSCWGASTIRLKENVQSLDSSALNLLNQLRPVSFDWKADSMHMATNRGLHDFGLIAEEVNNVLPSAVATDANGQVQGITYQSFIPFLIQGIKEQQSQISDLQSAVQTLQSLSMANGGVMDGPLEVTGTLNVYGHTSVDTLVVNDDAVFRGTLQVETLHINGKISVNGHIITGGNMPTVDSSLLSCLDDIQVGGNDTAGTVSFKVEEVGCTIADLRLAFATRYEAAPNATLTAKDRISARLQSSLDATEDKMTFAFDGLQAGKTYRFTYHVIQ